MLSTKIRTTIIALVATSSFAAASIVPAVSQAAKNTGAYSKSAESTKAAMCHMITEYFNEALQDLAKAHASGDQAAINKARENVNADYLEGYENGCAWATRVTSPSSPTSGIVAPVEVQAAPEGALPPVQGVQPTSVAPTL
jgi:hypothetical protein